ncbi:MAG TPA: aminodeoxychorismate lyase [Steroidobacteraceae bacterium]|nr:aminodeoxychorismate lyase [Steroidobacteraceae bacterium]
MTADPVAAGALPELAWIDGRVATEVSLLERGLHYGDGLFETIACLGGRPRLLGLHLKRLAGGCARLGIGPPDFAQLADEVRQLAAGAPRAIVKVLVTRGRALARGYRPTGYEHPSRILLRYAWPVEEARLMSEGVRVRVAALRLGENPALAGLKHCNRLEQVVARREWHDPDIHEALLFSSSGALVSGIMSNVFLVRGERLLTPRVDRCGVAGVMRELVLTVAPAAGIACEECVLGESELTSARELFLTNALTGIRPVRELEGQPLTAGALTRRLQAQLAPLLSAAAAGGAAQPPAADLG